MKKEGTIQDSVEPSAEELYSGTFHPPQSPAENFSVLEICVPFELSAHARNWQKNLDFRVELDEILKKVKQRHKPVFSFRRLNNCETISYWCYQIPNADKKLWDRLEKVVTGAHKRGIAVEIRMTSPYR